MAQLQMEGNRAETVVPRAMPAWVYDNPEIARLEYERILLPSWQILCHVNSIPKPGDYVTLDLGRDSIVATRAGDGTIHAFHNVCRHRAARLLEGSGSCGALIRCPYHGWSYGLDGALRGVPVRDSFPGGLTLGELGLKPVRTELFLGFVWVAVIGDPAPLAEAWAPFAADFAPYDFDSLQPLGPICHDDWDVDWKVAMDNYLESYHVPIGHPGLNRMFTADYIGMVMLPSGVARGVGHMKERPSPRWTERQYQKWAPDVATALPDAERRCWRYYSMLPNLGIDVFPDQMDFFQVLPRSSGKCSIRSATFALPDDRREMKLLRYMNARINRDVMREDAFLCKRVQQGLTSQGYEPGPLSDTEMCMRQFHDLLRQRIPEMALDRAPTTFA
jgi:phenylpropionate dioxygenase-like ring-hydroxylating dioxygenase large terminal subunit